MSGMVFALLYIEMKIGIPVFNGRVSPVFNWAKKLMIAQTGKTGKKESAYTIELDEHNELDRVALLAGEGVQVLICAGICRALLKAISYKGIQVIPGIVGEIDDVLDAYKNGTLAQPKFRMPGYNRIKGGRRGQFKKRHFMHGQDLR
ncbi:MAG: hypothetical protein GXP33_10925 [Spirochaetes bacterium]|nr:hypothetical protein [Spirochaetota bacterium]